MRSQATRPATYREEYAKPLFSRTRWDVFSARHFCVKFAPISPIDCEFTAVFSRFCAGSEPAKRPTSLSVSNVKIPEQSPLNYVLIGQTGRNLLKNARI